MARRLVALVALAAFAVGCEPPPPEYPSADPEGGDVQDVQVAAQADAYADTDPSALTDFRPALDPHGTWIEHPTYGTVWVPNPAEVGPDFAPYMTAGHWVYDNDEYVWVSDYSWGWAPFHYGRWVWAEGAGWVWVPGRVYAGAWVNWRVGDDGYGYVGWGPMPPYWGWYGGVVVFVAVPPRTPYMFCPREHLFAPNPYAHVVPHDRAMEVGGRTHALATPAPGHAGGHAMIPSPHPSSLGHDMAHVPHAAAGDANLGRARAFGRPSTAAPLGGHAPATHSVKKRGGSAPAHSSPSRGGGGRGGRGKR